MSENHTYLLNNDYRDEEIGAILLVSTNDQQYKAFAPYVRLRRIFVLCCSVNFNLADSNNRNMISYEIDENSIYVNRILYSYLLPHTFACIKQTNQSTMTRQ